MAASGSPRSRGRSAETEDQRLAAGSARQLRAVLDSSPMAILAVDREDIVQTWNLAATRMFGWTEEEVVGRPLPIVPASERTSYLQLIERINRGEEICALETMRERKDGSPVVVSWTAAPLRDASGETIGSMRIFEDITERRSLEAQLRQAQKMEAIGQLAAGVAHDFNNILTAILGYSDLALAELPLESRSRHKISEIRRGGMRAADLTRQLLAFSRQQILEVKVLDPSQVVAQLEGLLRPLLGEDIHLETRLAPDAGHVRADPSQLEQIVMNLVVNARDAMPHGGRLAIETANVDLPESHARTHLGSRPGPHVMLAVTDTGTGMDKETQARIFEPFFTTKQRGHGTGLGLSTVYGIVKQSGGSIWVYSEPGRGTAFKVYLPRVDAPAESTRSRQTPSALPPGTETALLVEDDELVLGLLSEMLESLGYGVLRAGDSEQALAIVRDESRPIHLLVTDVVLPGTSGPELVAQVVAQRPQIQVLYLSGYTDNTIVHHGVLEAGVNFLQKPITRAALAHKLREVLAKAAG